MGWLVILCVCIGIVCSRLSMGVVWFGCSYLNWNLKQLSRRPFPSFTMSPMWLMVMRIYLYWTRIWNKTIWSIVIVLCGFCSTCLWFCIFFICNAIFDCMDEFLCLRYFFSDGLLLLLSFPCSPLFCLKTIWGSAAQNVLPPFFCLIVCDLISDGGGYLQFAGGSKEVPGSQDASLQLRESLPKVVTSGARPLHRGFYRNCQGKQIVLHDMA